MRSVARSPSPAGAGAAVATGGRVGTGVRGPGSAGGRVALRPAGRPRDGFAAAALACGFAPGPVLPLAGDGNTTDRAGDAGAIVVATAGVVAGPGDGDRDHA